MIRRFDKGNSPEMPLRRASAQRTMEVRDDWVSDPAPRPHRVPPVGTIIGDGYRIERLVGEGGMGLVMLATDLTLEREVAIKLIRREAADDGARDRFLVEARAMAGVRHENVVQIYNFGEHERQPYFVMEYVPGTTVGDWLDRHALRGELPTIDEALGIIDQVCRGVSAIHAAGIIHADIKPGNVLLGPAFRAAVTDFGLVRMRGQREDESMIVGTPGYIPPEVVLSTDPLLELDRTADVYGLAVVAYEMLTGVLPLPIDNVDQLFDVHGRGQLAKQPSLVRDDLPAAFDAVLLEALAPDPKERTPSPDAFRRGLIAARASSVGGVNRIRVLVADDDEDFLSIAREALDLAFPGAVIECVPDGDAAFAAVERKVPSLAVIDLDMPGMNGVELTAMLRASEAGKDLPIVVVTAHGGALDWKLLSAMGADGFLVKPLDPYALVALARRTLGAASGR